MKNSLSLFYQYHLEVTNQGLLTQGRKHISRDLLVEFENSSASQQI